MDIKDTHQFPSFKTHFVSKLIKLPSLQTQNRFKRIDPLTAKISTEKKIRGQV